MVRKILLTDSIDFIKRHLDNMRGDIFYYVVEETKKTNLIRNHLLSISSAREITVAGIIDEKTFAKQYSFFLYNLNIKNKSKIWWAMNFTNKSPLLNPLCKDIFDFLAIVKLIETKEKADIIVCLSKRKLAYFIKRYLSGQDASVYARVSSHFNIKYLLSIIPAFFLTYTFLKLGFRIILSKSFLKKPLPGSDKKYIIITQFEDRSFVKDEGFSDIYFGQLRNLAKAENKKILISGFISCHFKKILKHSRHLSDNQAYPLEFFLPLSLLFRCFKNTMIAYFKRRDFNGDTEICGKEVRWLVENEIDRAYKNGEILVNLSVYYCVEGLLKKIPSRKILYPFENRPWEKMILLAARQVGHGIRTAGYQHASLTPKHMNYVLENGEIANAPFPDEIISMGRITKEIMENFFGFPSDYINVGCALRHHRILSAGGSSEKRKGTNLFVALASSLDEYVKIIRFLDASSLNEYCYVKIRAHPTVSIYQALEIYKPSKLKFTIDNNKTLFDSLAESDIVLYASSTVGIEALHMGKPVIYIKFGDFINSDPLFSFKEFKWNSGKAEELAGIIDEITSLKREDFQSRREEGIQYAEEYFYPVSKKNIEAFFKI